MATCALCKETAELRRSHIIPKFTHKRIKKEDGTLLRFDKDSHLEGDRVQDVFYEKLLCGTCEARFQKWEEHAARMINQKHVFDFPQVSRPRLIKISGFDYPRMKLFLLSILWRMGVATSRPFSNVKLGPHSQRIGRMLLDDDPGEITDYGCTVSVVHMDGERITLTRPGDSIMYETQNLPMCRALVDGLLFAWIVGSKEHMDRFRAPDLLLQLDGTWLTYAHEWHEISFLHTELGKLGNGTLFEGKKA